MDVEREANISAVLPGYPRPRRRVSFSEDDQRHPILNTHGYKILEILATGSYNQDVFYRPQNVSSSFYYARQDVMLRVS